MHVLRWFLVALFAFGCYASYSDLGDGDDVTSADARPDRADDVADRPEAARDEAADDADGDAPGEHYWTLLQVPATLESWACTASPGQTGFVELAVDLRRSCWHVGPAETRVVDTPTGMPAVEVRAYVWEERGVECVDVAAESPYVYEVALPFLELGTWPITEPLSGSTITREVWEAPGPTSCTDPGPAGSECFVDCECLDGMACGAARGDAWCGATCLRPCNADVDCPSRSACTHDWTWAGHGCEAAPDGDDLCAGDEECPVGMRCAISEHGRFCTWAVELNVTTRRACVSDEGCDPGLDCVERADGTRRCELRCTTPGMVCPPMHGCGMRLGDGSQLWICEWWGE